MAKEETKPKFSFDGTINVSTLITGAIILVGGISFANAMSANVTQLVNQVGETRNDLKSMQTDISDIKSRLSVLEERTRNAP